MAASGTAGTAITQPTVTCNGSNNTSTPVTPTWTGAPAWANPAAGTYTVSATAICGGSSKTASCGTLTVASVLACASVPSSGTAGMAITAPTVTCDGATVSSGLSWTGAPTWANPTAGTYSSVSVSASSGNCSGKTAGCNGTLTVQSLAIYGTPVPYEGEIYQTVVIGTQTWMARNLNYAVAGSRCYGDNSGGDSQNRCGTYGRLYDWATAMALAASCNSSSCSEQVSTKHRGVCPSGWHIPSEAEWYAPLSYVESNKGCTVCAAKHLKSTSGWNSNASGWISNGNGLDSYGFSALPGGYGYSNGSFYDVGNGGRWWSASMSSDYAYYRSMSLDYEGVFWGNDRKDFLYSVRCLQD